MLASPSLTIEDLWEQLSDLTDELSTDDSETIRTDAAREDRANLIPLGLSDTYDGMAIDSEEYIPDDEDSIPERFVYTRFILRQSLRMKQYVDERLIGAARESWELIAHHSAECPGVIALDLEERIAETLDELVARSPIDLEDRYKHERWLPAMLNQVSQAIAARVADEPKLLARMTARGFEDFISKLFVTFGYDVELTKQTRDGGYDVIALKKYRDGPHKLLIEAKRYARARPVGVAVVRQLLHVRDENRATRVVLATTSHFTKGARELYRKHEYELELRDYDDLMSWAREAADLLNRAAANGHYYSA